MLAFVFPGQGSQAVGMARELYDSSPIARQVLDELAGAVDFPLLSLMFEGPAEELTQTQCAQPALLAHSLAALAVLRAGGLQPGLMAGHSLGEYSAVVAGGCLSPTDAVRLVRRRGELMAEAGQRVGGAMAAIIGLEEEPLQAAVAEAGEVGVVCIANLNAPGQIVISGAEAAVKRASELAVAAGARRALPLKVSGAFHSPLMQPAAEEFAAVLQSVALTAAQVPVISNVDARERTGAEEIREALARQLTSAVQWDLTMQRLPELGVTGVVEVGPGKVLANMLRRACPDLAVQGAETLADIEAAVAALGT